MGDPLTPLDATFLELEQLDEGATMHIGGVLLFDPLPDGTVPSLEAVCTGIASRLSVLPRYTQRLSSERTGRLAWPQWRQDPQFDLRNHVHRAALPAPGGDAEMCEWAADFFSHRLDRTRPLWEMVLVEGLEHDQAAGILGLSPEALRQRLARARAGLAERLGKTSEPNAPPRSRMKE